MPKPFGSKKSNSPSAPARSESTAGERGAALESKPTPGKRRVFTAAEKLRIVREAEATTERGGIEALLRREGIYSSLLANWRSQLAIGGSDALVARKPGRKPKHDAKDKRILELEKRATRLEAKLVLAEKLLALQKKVSEILGFSLDGAEES